MPGRPVDWVLWTVVAVAAASMLVTVLDLSEARRLALGLTSHALTPVKVEAEPYKTVAEYLRWGFIAVPVIALLIAGSRLLASRRARRSPGAALPAAAFAGPEPLRIGFALFFFLQLTLGAAFLAGAWTTLDEKFRNKTDGARLTPNEIRREFLPRDFVTSVRLARRIPVHEDLLLLADPDPGVTPVFLNYFLYPRAVWHPEYPGSLASNADRAGFWREARREGAGWVFLFHPFSDAVAHGNLIDLRASDGLAQRLPAPLRDPATDLRAPGGVGAGVGTGEFDMPNRPAEPDAPPPAEGRTS